MLRKQLGSSDCFSPGSTCALFASTTMLLVLGCQSPSTVGPTALEVSSADASAKSGRRQTLVDICHRTAGVKSFIPMKVAHAALGAHLGHGDGRVDGVVPGQPGFVFAPDCSALPAVPPTIGIEVPLTGSRTGFGGSAVLGQTFIAIGAVAEQLTVYVGPTSDPQGVRFRVLVTEVTTNPPFGPTSVLFETNTLALSFAPEREPEAFTIDLHGLPLEVGRSYAIVLDACSEFDGTQGSASVGIDLSAGYAVGVFFERPPNPIQPVPCDRDAVFAAHDWLVSDGIDLAFTLSFASSQAVSRGRAPRVSTLAFR